MARKGKKTRSAGRFGVRYGVKARKLVADIEERMRTPHRCNRCGKPAVKRTDTGIWKCRKCGYTFAGGTYLPQTSVEQIVLRAVQRYEGEHSE